MKHHILHEEHVHVKCIYCNNELHNHIWKSEFNAEHHYKFTVCENCGRKTHTTMGFNGSGHDDWNIRAYSGLENKIIEKSPEK